MDQTIPVADLKAFVEGSPADQAHVVNIIGDALVEYGFVAIDNHGVDRFAIADTYAAAKDFFGLAPQQKQRYEDPAGGRQRGYTSFGQEHAKNRSVADLKEFWHVGPEFSAEEAARTRLPANVWPAETARFRDASLSLWESLHQCGVTLLRAIARYLEVDEAEFSSIAHGGNTILRIIRYPGSDELTGDTGDGVWAAEHEDINLITLLPEATERGLELLTRDGQWLPIEPVPGQLIVDAGDMLQRLTNGKIPSTTHRVLAPEGHTGPRYSMPFFMHPHPDCLLTPVPSCVGPDQPRQYEDITAEGYLNERLREIGLLSEDTYTTRPKDD